MNLKNVSLVGMVRPFRTESLFPGDRLLGWQQEGDNPVSVILENPLDIVEWSASRSSSTSRPNTPISDLFRPTPSPTTARGPHAAVQQRSPVPQRPPGQSQQCSCGHHSPPTTSGLAADRQYTIRILPSTAAVDQEHPIRSSYPAAPEDAVTIDSDSEDEGAISDRIVLPPAAAEDQQSQAASEDDVTTDSEDEGAAAEDQQSPAASEDEGAISDRSYDQHHGGDEADSDHSRTSRPHSRLQSESRDRARSRSPRICKSEEQQVSLNYVDSSFFIDINFLMTRLREVDNYASPLLASKFRPKEATILRISGEPKLRHWIINYSDNEGVPDLERNEEIYNRVHSVAWETNTEDACSFNAFFENLSSSVGESKLYTNCPVVYYYLKSVCKFENVCKLESRRVEFDSYIHRCQYHISRTHTRCTNNHVWSLRHCYGKELSTFV